MNTIAKPLISILKTNYIAFSNTSKLLRNMVDQNRVDENGFDDRHNDEIKRICPLFPCYRDSSNQIILLSKLKKPLIFYKTRLISHQLFTILT